MNEWPSGWTLLFLVCGLIPPLKVLYDIRARGIQGLATLKACLVLFMWFGYHATPWVNYLTGSDWTGALVVASEIDTCIVFSSLCMLAVMLAYAVYARSHPPRREVSIVEVPAIHVLAAVMVTLTFMLIFVGGPAELMKGTKARGEGQFEVRTASEGVKHMSGIVASLAGIATSGLSAGLIYGTSSLTRRGAVLAGLLGLLAGSMPAFYGFSRGAGLSCVILAMTAIRFGGKSRVLAAAASLACAIVLSLAGYTLRSSAVGVGYFVETIASLEMTGGGGPAALMTSGADWNPLDQVPSWTRMASFRSTRGDGAWASAIGFFLNLQPVPSEWIPVVKVAPSLSEAMGTWGSTGITTPAMAEIYFVFGWWGGVIVYGLGYLFSWFEARPIRVASSVHLIAFWLFFASIPIGLHSSTRAMTRPLLYAGILTVLVRLCTNTRVKMADHSPATARTGTGRAQG